MKFGLDIVTLAVLLLFAVLGAKKGLIKSCVDFFGALIAMIGAAIFSGPAAEWVYTTFFRTSLVEKITTAITGLSDTEAVYAVFDDFPDMIQRALSASGITESSVLTQLQNGALSAAEGITDALSPMLIGLIRVLAMLVLFVLLLVIIRAVAVLLSGLFELPVLHGLNRLLGAVFGILMAVVVIWIVLACVQVFTPLLTLEMQSQVNEVLENSAFSGMLYNFNPVYILIG